MSVTNIEFENRIYETWAKHIGLSKEDLRKRGYHIESLSKLHGTQKVQLFKLGRFSYVRCDGHLHDLLDKAIGQILTDDTIEHVSGNNIQGILTVSRS